MECKEEHFACQAIISDPIEEKIYGAYMYRYQKNSWKDVSNEEETSEPEMEPLGISIGVFTNISGSHLKIALYTIGINQEYLY